MNKNPARFRMVYCFLMEIFFISTARFCPSTVSWSVAILAQAQNCAPVSHLLLVPFAMAENAAYVTYVGKNAQNPYRVLAPGMEVKTSHPTLQNGTPLVLTKGISHLALLARLFRGNEVGYLAEAKLQEELYKKCCQTNKWNTAPLEVLLLSLGAAKNKASAEAMVYHRVRSLKNFVYDDPDLPAHVQEEAGVPSVTQEAAGEGPPAQVKEEPGVPSVKQEVVGSPLVQTEPGARRVKYIVEVNGRPTQTPSLRSYIPTPVFSLLIVCSSPVLFLGGLVSNAWLRLVLDT